MGQVLLNVRIFSQMPLNKVNDGNVSFVTPNEKGELVKYLVRVKAPSAIDLFSILLKEAK